MHQQEDVLNMIWEVDDDLNGYVNWEEFLTMYKRAVFNNTGWLLVTYIMCAHFNSRKFIQRVSDLFALGTLI